MPNYTENYGLKKPLPNENYNVQDHNDNMDIIDTELKKVNDKVDSIEIPVTSVNGKVGDVELTAADIGAETPAGAQAKAEAAAAAAVAAHEEDPDPHEQYALEADLAALQEEVNTHKAECAVLLPKVGSTANDILLDIVLTDKKKGSFRAATNNTGNMTLNGKPFKKDASTQIPSGGVKAGKVYDFYYDQDSDCVFILAKASGNAQPSDVLAGKTFSNDDGEQEGTMPNRAGDNAALAISRSGTTLKLRAPKGFYDGTDDNVTYNEPNWIAANIPVGISMFGLAGSNPYKSGAEVNYKQLGLLEPPIVKMLPSSSIPRYNSTYKPTVYDCLEGDYLAVQITTNNLGVINIKTGVILWQETGQTLNIIGVTVKNGKLYALKTDNYQIIIKVYNLTTGAAIASVGNSSPNYRPHGIMADSDGYIYTFGVYAQGDYNQRIWVYNSSLSYVAEFGNFENDLVYVLPTPSGPPVFWNYDRFYRINAGRTSTQWYSSQISPDYQSMVCTDNYVWSNPSKTANGQLSLFNISTGALVKTISTGIPSYLTIIGRDEGDFIYAKDSDNFVHRIDTDGNTEMIYKFGVAHSTHISSYKRHIEYRPQQGKSYATRLEKITLP